LKLAAFHRAKNRLARGFGIIILANLRATCKTIVTSRGRSGAQASNNMRKTIQLNKGITPALSRLATVLIAVIESSAAHGAPHDIPPLANAHAHNDYLHARPLMDALDHGFTSVEADVFPVDGKLLVGHTRNALKPERTLESLYLAPLAERVRQNGGFVYEGNSRFFLLIDIKRDPQEAYQELQSLFAKYSSMLTTIESGKVRPGAVTVVLTGYTPKIESAGSGPRYAGLDGRMSDLDSRSPAHLMPMVSDNWTKQFHWDGNGAIPDDERAKLRGIVKKAHASGRVVRFWATPEKETVWRELRAAGVDLINTDELDRLAAFLRTPDAKPEQK
jgi:Glycerophosphoryl diester phosphodiesterase family